MAELNKTDFEAKYNHVSTGLFKTNTSNAIGSDDLRAEVTDLKESVLWRLDDRYTLFQQFTTTTSTTAYVGTTSPAITAYANGQIFQVKAHATSTGAVTFNWNTLGAKKVYTNPTTQATTGSLVENTIYLVAYDTALDSAVGGFLIVGGSGGGSISDTAYGSGWNGDTTNGASKNALYDKIETLVTKVGTPANNQIGVWTGDGTIEGDAELTFDGSVLSVNPTNNGFVQFGDVAAPMVGIDVYASDDGLGGGGARFFMSGGQGYFEIHQDNSGQSLLFYGDDGGLRYGGDYSADYVDRTLVDKAYVDNAGLAFPVSLITDTTQLGNITTGEDTLFQYTLPGATLATNGNSIKGRISGTIAANANNKTLKVKFGSTTFLTTLMVTSLVSSGWTCEFEIIRTGATTQKCNTTFNNPDGISASVYATAGETLSGNIAIVVTGDATSTNDIVKETIKITFYP